MRYRVDPSRNEPGTFNVIDTKKVIAVKMRRTKAEAEAIATKLNGDA